ncbi:hypothetical protein EJ04DRAFT_598591, partial [Polyplosphaeria fusca]
RAVALRKRAAGGGQRSAVSGGQRGQQQQAARDTGRVAHSWSMWSSGGWQPGTRGAIGFVGLGGDVTQCARARAAAGFGVGRSPVGIRLGAAVKPHRPEIGLLLFPLARAIPSYSQRAKSHWRQLAAMGECITPPATLLWSLPSSASSTVTTVTTLSCPRSAARWPDDRPLGSTLAVAKGKRCQSRRAARGSRRRRPHYACCQSTPTRPSAANCSFLAPSSHPLILSQPSQPWHPPAQARPSRRRPHAQPAAGPNIERAGRGSSPTATSVLQRPTARRHGKISAGPIRPPSQPSDPSRTVCISSLALHQFLLPPIWMRCSCQAPLSVSLMHLDPGGVRQMRYWKDADAHTDIHSPYPCLASERPSLSFCSRATSGACQATVSSLDSIALPRDLPLRKPLREGMKPPPQVAS